MLDQTSLKIEELAKREGSYIDACCIFAEQLNFTDFEDLIEILHPQLVKKIKQEFIEKNYIPALKKHDSLAAFF